MSKYYSIDIKLHAECNEYNIAKILERGSQNGFKYYDGIGEIRDKKTGLLGARTVAKKIMEAYETEPELGPCVYTILPNDHDDNVYLWFYKADDGFLELHMASFGAPKKRICLLILITISECA